MIDQFVEDKSPAFVLLHEWEDPGFDLSQRYNQLADDASLYCCDWLCDFSEKYQGDRESFYDHQSRYPSRQHGNLTPSPYADRFRLGLELLKTLINQNDLTLPKSSTLYEQLTRFAADDLKTKKVSQTWYAINAARFAIGSYRQEPIMLRESSRRPYGKSQNQWMAS